MNKFVLWLKYRKPKSKPVRYECRFEHIETFLKKYCWDYSQKHRYRVYESPSLDSSFVNMTFIGKEAICGDYKYIIDNGKLSLVPNIEIGSLLKRELKSRNIKVSRTILCSVIKFLVENSINDIERAFYLVNKFKKEQEREDRRTKREKNRGKNNYYKECWEYTESIKMFIPNIEKRQFKKYDIDHIVPIIYGYKHNIPPSLIGSLENLRIIKNQENFRKNSQLTEDSIFLLRKWGYNVEYP